MDAGGKCHIYVKRKFWFPGAAQPCQVWVNGKNVGVVTAGGVWHGDVPSGPLEVGLGQMGIKPSSKKSFTSPGCLQFEAQPGETYYMQTARGGAPKLLSAEEGKAVCEKKKK